MATIKISCRGITNTARMRIDLKNLEGEPPSKTNRWGWFSADIEFNDEIIGSVGHNTAGTDLRIDQKEDELREFADEFPVLPPHGDTITAETLIRMIAFSELLD